MRENNNTILILSEMLCNVIEQRDLLIEALKPLAELNLTGVTGEIVYQRDYTFIKKSDVMNAKQLLESLKP